jgi:hypothetical protein
VGANGTTPTDITKTGPSAPAADAVPEERPES